MSWDDERVEQLKKLWGDGISASQIAERMGRLTRSAVIGKVHRLGLSGRATTQRLNGMNKKTRKRKVAAAGTPAATRNWASFVLPEATEVEPLPQPSREFDVAKLVKFDALEADHCRWPVGDPRDETFGFCGEKKVVGQPYCVECCRVAFRPPPLKKRAGGAAGGQIDAFRGAGSRDHANAVPGASERDLEGVS